MPLPDGASVPLSQVADIRVVDGPVKVDREKRAHVGGRANVRDRDLVGFVEEAKAVAREVRCHRATAPGAASSRTSSAPPPASVVVPVALALIFCAVLHLRPVRQALLVLANIPFALVGGVLRWVPGRIPVGAGLGGLHRAAGHRRAQRRGAGDLLQPARRGMPIGEVVRQGACAACARC
jgi:cobalt-zinc-cadmium resistance protein CzcA